MIAIGVRKRSFIAKVASQNRICRRRDVWGAGREQSHFEMQLSSAQSFKTPIEKFNNIMISVVHVRNDLN
jgi:hypothetical protein